MELVALAQRVAAATRTGTLCTLDPDGFPFGSLVNVALDAQRRPILLLSRLAEHTQHLARDDRASLLLVQAEEGPDVLASPRLTLIGRVKKHDDGAARDAFLAAHPSAAAYAGFADFAWHVLEPERIRLVAGFGRMGWLTPKDYTSA